MQTIETKRLILRDIKEEDKHELFINIFHDKEVLRYFLAKYQENESDVNLSKLVERANSGLMYYSIILKETGEVIGIFNEQKHDDNSIEVGYAIGSKYWNKGYITECFKAIINYFFKNDLYKEVSAAFLIDNKASEKVMKKCGLTYRHTVKNEVTLNDKVYDVVYYSIIKNI